MVFANTVFVGYIIYTRVSRMIIIYNIYLHFEKSNDFINLTDTLNCPTCAMTGSTRGVGGWIYSDGSTSTGRH